MCIASSTLLPLQVTIEVAIMVDMVGTTGEMTTTTTNGSEEEEEVGMADPGVAEEEEEGRIGDNLSAMTVSLILNRPTLASARNNWKRR